MKIAVLLPYANPHVMGWVNELNKQYNSSILIGSVYSVKRFRNNYFSFADTYNNVVYFFKRNPYKDFYKLLGNKEVFISLGMFSFPFIKSLFFLKKNTKIIVLSEPYNTIPFLKKIFQRLFSFIIFLKFKKENFSFLAMGGKRVKQHYTKVGFSDCKFYNFGYFPELSFSKKETRNTYKKVNFLFVGQLIKRKGIDILIKFIDYLEENHKGKWSFTIIGDGVLKNDLTAKISHLADVEYKGLVNDKSKIDNLYKKADVFFLPSYFDGWGAVVNEAISKSCSLLISKNVYASEGLLLENKNGFSFNPYDFYSLTRKADLYFNSDNILMSHFEYSAKLYKEWNHVNAGISIKKILFENKNNNNLTLLKEI